MLYNHKENGIMLELEFDIQLTAEEFLQFYQGSVNYILVRSHNGQTIQFSADKMRPYITDQGISGSFILKLDKNNKFISLKRK